ncbi:transglutaminase-like domain-containing protein, partial [Pseudacidovorax intermedius]
KPVGYEITLEPSNRPWLLALDAMRTAPALPDGLRALQGDDLQWSTNRPIGDLLRYRGQSQLDFTSGPVHRAGLPGFNLALPPGSNPRTAALARQLQAQAGGSTTALVDAVLQRLRTGGYVYTLEPGVYGAQTADEFWFDRKAGFCEHIASSFVILMRAAGVPARIVTGFQGGEINPVDGY